jgi:hypothetical protein
MTQQCKKITGIPMKYTFTLIAVFISLAGCSEELPEDYDRVVMSTLLNATWRTECVIDGENSYLPTLTITSNGGENYDTGTGTSSNIYHTGDTTCATLDPEIQDINTFSYSLGEYVIVDGSVDGLTEAMQIDTVNTTEESPDIGAVEYDIFAIKDKFTLYFGDKTEPTNGTTADLRPTQLTDVVKYIR